jgi:hypothetical protein
MASGRCDVEYVKLKFSSARSPWRAMRALNRPRAVLPLVSYRRTAVIRVGEAASGTAPAVGTTQAANTTANAASLRLLPRVTT